VTIDATVYNGKILVHCIENNFMCENDVINAILSLKTKNSVGYDRIPQWLITDDIQILIKPLTTLFSKIYNQIMLPEQWLFSKITPVPKQKKELNHRLKTISLLLIIVQQVKCLRS
jgi:hypothetical protein